MVKKRLVISWRKTSACVSQSLHIIVHWSLQISSQPVYCSAEFSEAILRPTACPAVAESSLESLHWQLCRFIYFYFQTTFVFRCNFFPLTCVSDFMLLGWSLPSDHVEQKLLIILCVSRCIHQVCILHIKNTKKLINNDMSAWWRWGIQKWFKPQCQHSHSHHWI